MYINHIYSSVTGNLLLGRRETVWYWTGSLDSPTRMGNGGKRDNVWGRGDYLVSHLLVHATHMLENNFWKHTTF